MSAISPCKLISCLAKSQKRVGSLRDRIGVIDINCMVFKSSQVDSKALPITQLSTILNMKLNMVKLTVNDPAVVDAAF